MINQYKNVGSPKVLGEIDIYEFLDNIKHPDPLILSTIINARELYNNGYREEYNLIKTTELPCYTLNFTYNGYKKDTNIKEPSGLIYIDHDEGTNIDLSNEYIFATWTSLSNNGRGIIVRVENLSLDNFNITYEAISADLGINSDKHAKKASQFTVQSYDPNLYYNEDAFVWKITPSFKNNPITYTSLKKEKKDSNELGLKVRFNNLDEIDFKGKPFVVFMDKKIEIAELFIPKKIRIGSRNNIVSAIAYQLMALNPFISIEDFRDLMNWINERRCEMKLPENEIISIINNSYSSKNNKPVLNKERRLIYSLDSNLSKKEKDKIKGEVIGRVRVDNTKKLISSFLDNWNVSKDGKVTQKKLAEVSGKNIKTINKYYSSFRAQIKSINEK